MTTNDMQKQNGLAVLFHGTSDPWAKTPEIIDACLPRGIPLHIVENANHSLETGNLDIDLHTLKETMEKVRRFLMTGDEGYVNI